MTAPAVSVVIPVFDGERHVGEAIDSALAQTHRPLEVVVVDDGSTDRSAEIARARGATVLRLDHAGPAAARNAGVRAARGDVVAFLDADDVWLPRKLELQLAVLTGEPPADFVLAHLEEFVSPELDVAAAARLRPRPPRASYAPSVLVAWRRVLEELPFADAATGEFLDWMLRARDRGLREVMLPQVVARRRLHGANHSLRGREARPELAHMLKRSLDRRRAER